MKSGPRSYSRIVRITLVLLTSVLPAQVNPSQAGTAGGPQQNGNDHFHHVFFFDVSGSMKTTLGMSGSPARLYLAEHFFGWPQLFEEGQPASAYSFTVKCRREFSGPLRYSAIRQLLLSGLPITHENTDLVETVTMAEEERRQNPNGVTLAWILTDNANDPAGTGPDEENTRKFYGRMFEENTSAQRMYFFPLKDVKLVIYLLVFAPDASLQGTDIDRFEDELGGFARKLGAPKIRARPVGGERPLEFADLSSTGEQSHLMAQVVGIGAKSSLVVTGFKEGQPLTGRFHLRVRSRFDEWRVEHADVEAIRLEEVRSDDFPNISGKMVSRLIPPTLSVDPRGESSIIYTLELGDDSNEAPKAPFFTPAALSSQSHGTITGKLVLKIANPDLTLKIFNDPATTAAIQSVFRLKDIAYFVPKSATGKDTRLDFTMPVQFQVDYNPLPRWAALGGILLLPMGAAIWIFVARGKGVECRLVGYQEDTFTLTPAAAFPIVPNRVTLAELRKTMFGHIMCKPRSHVAVNGSSKPARIANGSKIELTSEDSIYSYRLEILSHRKAAVADKSADTTAGGYY